MTYDPSQWRDYFVMVGGGAAALTGLVFVAMSLNVSAITANPAHRYRAIGTLTGFASAFVLCALALMGGQNYQAIGAEWLIVSLLAAAVYFGGYVRALRAKESFGKIVIGRVIFGTGCGLAEIAGSVALLAGQVVGLYIDAITLVVYVAYLITGAWLLVVWEYNEP